MAVRRQHARHRRPQCQRHRRREVHQPQIIPSLGVPVAGDGQSVDAGDQGGDGVAAVVEPVGVGQEIGADIAIRPAQRHPQAGVVGQAVDEQSGLGRHGEGIRIPQARPCQVPRDAVRIEVDQRGHAARRRRVGGDEAAALREAQIEHQTRTATGRRCREPGKDLRRGARHGPQAYRVDAALQPPVTRLRPAGGAQGEGTVGGDAGGEAEAGFSNHEAVDEDLQRAKHPVRHQRQVGPGVQRDLAGGGLDVGCSARVLDIAVQRAIGVDEQGVGQFNAIHAFLEDDRRPGVGEALQPHPGIDCEAAGQGGGGTVRHRDLVGAGQQQALTRHTPGAPDRIAAWVGGADLRRQRPRRLAVEREGQRQRAGAGVIGAALDQQDVRAVQRQQDVAVAVEAQRSRHLTTQGIDQADAEIEDTDRACQAVEQQLVARRAGEAERLGREAGGQGEADRRVERDRRRAREVQQPQGEIAGGAAGRRDRQLVVARGRREGDVAADLVTVRPADVAGDAQPAGSGQGDVEGFVVRQSVDD